MRTAVNVVRPFGGFHPGYGQGRDFDEAGSCMAEPVHFELPLVGELSKRSTRPHGLVGGHFRRPAS
jgi:hypothetical protein